MRFLRKIITVVTERYSFNTRTLGFLFNPWYFARRALWYNIKTLSSHLNGKCLDIGCGVKPYRSLFKNVESYIGLEHEGCDKVLQETDVLYDGNIMPFQDGEFDSIICNEVLEHVFNPEVFLKEVQRVVKNNGILLFTVPFCWDEHEQPYDYARYSSFGLKYLMEKHNFKILEQHKTCSDITVIFQLINGYIYKSILKNTRFYYIKYMFVLLLSSIFNILGLLLNILLPKNTDLYLDNVLLLQKAGNICAK